MEKVFIETSVFIRFLTKDDEVKYGDCLIATQVPDDTTLISYDNDFTKTKKLKVTAPGEFIKLHRTA